MSDRDDFATDVVVESVDVVRVDEAVADPAARLHNVLDLAHHLAAERRTADDKQKKSTAAWLKIARTALPSSTANSLSATVHICGNALHKFHV